MSASHKRSWAWTCCAKPRVVWAKQPCLCWQSCSSWSRKRARFRRSCCATRVSLRTRHVDDCFLFYQAHARDPRSRPSLSALACTCPTWRWACTLVALPSRPTAMSSRPRFPPSSSAPLAASSRYGVVCTVHSECLLSPCVQQLAKEKALKLESLRHFILDECDKMLDNVGASATSADNVNTHTQPTHHRDARRRAGHLQDDTP